ncbi:MAG: hypothetical protein OXB95_04920, partial [Rhodobacteraceae bacterium]|nr:hypothetical protein [Paracoccaceae bacterium]
YDATHKLNQEHAMLQRFGADLGRDRHDAPGADRVEPKFDGQSRCSNSPPPQESENGHAWPCNFLRVPVQHWASFNARQKVRRHFRNWRLAKWVRVGLPAIRVSQQRKAHWHEDS